MPKSYRSPGTKAVKADHARKPIRVLIAGPFALVRAGLRVLLERIDQVNVAEASNAEEVFGRIKDFNPDIVLLDISTPDLGGLTFLKEIVAKHPSARLMALSQHDSEEHAVQVLRSGALGFIAKTATSAELERAVKTVASGEKYLPTELSSQAILKYLDDPRAFLSELTTRQREVLKMIAEGHTTKEIANKLEISGKTVETHRAQIMQRLDIHDIAGLVRHALRIGLVKLDE